MAFLASLRRIEMGDAEEVLITGQATIGELRLALYALGCKSGKGTLAAIVQGVTTGTGMEKASIASAGSEQEGTALVDRLNRLVRIDRMSRGFGAVLPADDHVLAMLPKPKDSDQPVTARTLRSVVQSFFLGVNRRMQLRLTDAQLWQPFEEVVPYAKLF